MITLNFHPEQAKELIALCELKIAQQIKIIDEANEVIKKYENVKSKLFISDNQIIESNNSTGIQYETPIYDYVKEATWKRKTLYAIEKIGRPATVNEIANVIIEMEPEVDRKKVIATISSLLSIYINKKEVFKRSQNDREEFMYSKI
jgi:hypothetical protein